MLLGDRIAPQTTEIGADEIVTVSYADRAPRRELCRAAFARQELRLLLDTDTLQFGELAQNFEGEANPAA